MRPVRDDGSLQAPILVIGEAPGRVEQAQGRPFLGPAGKQLARWMQTAGLSRQDCYITNVLDVQPPGNNLEAVDESEIDRGVQRLRAKIPDLQNLRCIVPCGNLALRAVLGLSGITKRRGYLYAYADGDRRIKTIPTIHPASVLYEASATDTAEGRATRRTWRLRCQADWHRIAAESRFAELDLPERACHRPLNVDDVKWLRSEIERNLDGVLVVDIETPPDRIETVIGYAKNGAPKIRKTWGLPYVKEVGFSVDPEWSMTVPTTLAFWRSAKRLDEVLDQLRAIFALPIATSTQNGFYDWWHLARPPFSIRPRLWKYDTLAMHHLRDPAEEHSLAFQASTLLRCAEWKSDPEDESYNGLDCCHQRELTDVHVQYLSQNGGAEQYEAHYRQLLMPLLDTMIRGLSIDDVVRRARLAELARLDARYRMQLAVMAGEDLYGKSDLSWVKLGRFLYETLGLPKQAKRDRKTGKVSVTTNLVTVRKLTVKYPEQMEKPAEAILGARRAQKRQQFYDDAMVDCDGRSHCSYGWTETLRLKSRTSPLSTRYKKLGASHQTFDHECRDHLVADAGQVAAKVDLSQIESRQIFGETGSEELIALARMPPWEHDQHSATAAQMARYLRTEVPRQLGKMTNHAAQRDMRGKTFAEHILKTTGDVFTPEECDALLEAYFQPPYDAIRTSYFRRIRQEIVQRKRLTAACGFVWRCDEERVSEDLFRRGYSLLPQHGAACHLNRHGMVPLYQFLRGRQSRIVVNEHDALWLSLDPEEGAEVLSFLTASLESAPLLCSNGVSLPMFAEVSIGPNFAFEKKASVVWKRLPPRSEVVEAVYRFV